MSRYSCARQLRSLRLLCAAAPLLAWGCSKDVVGPQPGLLEGGGVPPSPNVVCQDQLTTLVQIHGSDFSPIPVDVPNSPRTALPDIALTRSKDLDGSSAGGLPIVFSGDSDRPTNLELSSWQNAELMTVTVNQQVTLGDGMAGSLPVGIYDIKVTNPDGEAADFPGALAVVDRPSVAVPPVPGITCLAQGARQLTINGASLLDIGGDGPRLEVEGVAEPMDVPVAGLGSCEDVDGSSFATRYCTSASLTLAQDSIPVGYPSIVLRNPPSAACASEEVLHLRVVPPPSIERVEEPIACVAQGARALVIHGSGFLEVDGALPEVTLAGQAFTASVQNADCQALETMGHQVRSCSALHISVPQGALTSGTPELVVTNPGPSACESSDSTLLRIVDPPAVARVAAPVVCVAEGPVTVDIVGTGFLSIDGTLPTVRLGGETLAASAVALDASSCSALPTDGKQVQSCTKLTVTVAQDLLDAGLPDVSVENPTPAGCSDTRPGLLRVVPPPSVVQVLPALVCLDDGTMAVDIVGTDMLVVSGTAPTVTVGAVDLAAVAVSVNPADCSDLAVDGLDVQVCTKISALLPQDQIGAGVPNVGVHNPSPAACTGTSTNLLRVVSGPTLSGVSAPLACSQGVARPLVLTGTGFLDVNGTGPSVTIGGSAAGAALDGASCTPLAVNGSTVLTCTTLNVTAPADSLTPGHPAIVLTNPASAACQVSDASVLTVPPLIAFTSASPPAGCVTQGSQQVVITGSGFVRSGGDTFSVTVDGNAVTPTNISGCTSLDVPGLTAESCTSFTLDVDPSALGLGSVEIAVTNPAPADCGLSDSTIFEIAPPPTVSAVDPIAACTGDALAVDLTGTGFVDNMRVFFETDDDSIEADVSVSSATSAIASVTAPGLLPGTYDVRVDNGPGCESTLADALQIDPLPIVFFVTPPVLYNLTSIDATIFTAGLPEDADSVELVDSADVATDLTFSNQPGSPNRIVATIPSDLDPGDYEVRVTSALGCVGSLQRAVQVTDTLTLALRSPTPVDPSFVSPTRDTAVTIFADAASAPFENGAIGYLDSSGGGSSTAQPLRAVVVDANDPRQISAVVPGGMDPGEYDLIVINPDGAVAFAASALTVTSAEPPLITAVQPVSAANNANVAGTIFGKDFDANGVSVALRCRAPGGGATSVLAATVNNVTPTQVQVTLPVNGLTAETVCQVELTNDADGGKFSFSALSIRNPAANLAAWSNAGNNLVEARRALALVAARPTETSRFLYAIGGDGGALASAKTSVESASSDVFGTLGSWALQRNSLPAPRSQAGFAQLGRFVYLTGGHDGAAATATTLRAQVLDPLTTPVVSDLEAELGDGANGLEAGLWHYRIAALFPNGDASNPGGESLPGETFSVHVPAIDERVILTLHWDAIAGAESYRIYRTPVVDGAVGEVEGLGDVTCDGGGTPCEFTDDQQTATNSAQTPLRPGSLGVWHAVAALGSAREGHATVIAPKPSSSTEFFMYALGGRAGNGTFRSDFEFATITVAPGGGQTVSAWTAGSRDIGTAKADTAAWVITPNDSSVIGANEAYVFVGTGRTGVNTDTGEVRSGLVSATGDLTAVAASLDAETSASTGTGYAYAHGAGFLYTFGGERANSGNTLANDSSSTLSAGPTLGNWNSLGGGSLNTRRAFAACAQESAFYYVAGGRNGSSTALNSVEQTIQ
jgi:hypothetical protein